MSIIGRRQSHAASREEAGLRSLTLQRGLVQVLRHIHHALDMLVAQALALPGGQHLSRLQNVLDLATVHVKPCELVDILLVHGVGKRTGQVDLLRRLLVFWSGVRLRLRLVLGLRSRR